MNGMQFASISTQGRMRWVSRALVVLLIGYISAEWAFVATHGDAFRHELGGDFTDYRDAAQRWLSGSSFYEPWQLAGPYHIVSGAILYPPPILILLVPFTMLPAPLWWGIPFAVTGATVAHHRPRRWAWPILLLPFAFPYTNWLLINGTPTIWIVAVVALSTLRPWVSAFVLLKPSVFPFAAAGLRDRRWWAVAIGLLVVSMPMAPDYARVLLSSDGSVLYSIRDLPLLAVPVVAWLASSRRAQPAMCLRTAMEPDGRDPGTTGHDPPVPVTGRTTRL